MKRAAIILIREKEKKQINYLFAMQSALQNKMIEVFFLPDNKEVLVPRELCNRHPKSLTCIYNAVQFAREQQMDEILVLTDAFMGPVFSLDEFCDKLDSCTAAAWRLTRDSEMFGFKSSIWDLLHSCSCADDIIQLFTDLEKNMALVELYDTSDIAHLSIKPMTTEPLRIICEKRCPFFMHELFHGRYEESLRYSLGYQTPNFYKWLCQCEYWDVNLLWDYLLSSCHQDDYYWNMHLRYILPTIGADRIWTENHLKNHRLALVMHLYYPEKFMESISFARRFPSQTDLIITTNTEQKKDQLINILSHEAFPSYEVRLIENRGRDVSALLIGIADIYDQYDYICFFHDKKTLQTKPGTIGVGFAYRLEENMFATTDYVNHVIKLFNDNPRLGMLSPPAPHHAAYFFTLATDWGLNYDNTEELLRALKYNVPISSKHMPIAPLGTCFWFRPEAMKPLFSYGWNYLNFPPEPNKTDGTILHAIERIYPFACAEAGYYPAYLMSDRYAKIEYTNMRYYVEGYNRVCISHGILNKQKQMKDTIVSILRNQQGATS